MSERNGTKYSKCNVDSIVMIDTNHAYATENLFHNYSLRSSTLNAM